jgi:hypothetical protein
MASNEHFIDLSFCYNKTTYHVSQDTHRGHSIHIEGANIHRQDTARMRSFYIVLTSAKGQKLDHFKRKVNKIL